MPSQYAQEFSANTTWGVPAGVYVIEVELWGGGGGGGGGGSGARQNNATLALGGCGGVGGCSGQYVRRFMRVVPSETLTITLGAGGIGATGGAGIAAGSDPYDGAIGGIGTNGGVSSVTGTYTIQAAGGMGGNGGQAGLYYSSLYTPERPLEGQHIWINPWANGWRNAYSMGGSSGSTAARGGGRGAPAWCPPPLSFNNVTVSGIGGWNTSTAQSTGHYTTDPYGANFYGWLGGYGGHGWAAADTTDPGDAGGNGTGFCSGGGGGGGTPRRFTESGTEAVATGGAGGNGCPGYAIIRWIV